MSGQLPVMKSTKLVVLCAFERGENGELGLAFEPREIMSEDRAVALAREMATYHAGVITWTRSVKPDEGEFGEPGEVPERD